MNKNAVLLVTALVLSACTAVPEKSITLSESTEIVITAHQEGYDGTKTSLIDGGTQVYWEPGDEIKVFYGDYSSKFTSLNTEYATTASFSGSIDGFAGRNEGVISSGNLIWGLYPYREDAVSDGNTVTTTLPHLQTGRAGSFAKNTHIAIAKSANFNLAFYNVTTGIRFKLNNDGIRSVIFESTGREAIAGKFKVAFENERPVIQEIVEGQSRVTLMAPDGDSFETGKWYYIVTLPQTLANGFKVTFNRADDKAERSTSNSVTIRRGIFLSIDRIDEGVVFQESITPVDLGLSVKWASCNVGASSPEGYGDYYAWGETNIKSKYDWSTYNYSNGSYKTLTKYCSKSDYGYNGFTDDKTILELSDDAARVNLYDIWRMPTDAEWTEMRNNCTWTWTTQNGVDGYKVTSNSNGNSIFLPVAGRFYSSSINDYNRGYYWSSSKDSTGQQHVAYGMLLSSNSAGHSSLSRAYGNSVRAVYDEPVESVSLSSTTLSLVEGKAHQLTATVLPTNATNKEVSWSSSNTSVATVDSTGLVTAVGVGTTMITVMTLSGGCTATCEVTVISEVKVTSVSLSSKTLSLVEGEIRQLVATVLPSNATNKDLVWSSSNTIVATVDSDGIVTAVNAGTATITVTTQDGGYSASCTVSIIEGLVDLGLSVKWASCNIGASRPEEYGDYYAWGETETKNDYSLSTYKYCNGSNSTITKYCLNSNKGYNGFIDYKRVIELTDDVARDKFGGNYRIPTKAEWDELLANCKREKTTQNRVNGMKFTSKINGNSIFLPAAGSRNDTSLSGAGSIGEYWSSNLYVDDNREVEYSLSAYTIYFSESSSPASSPRYRGLSVRPVCGECVSVESISLSNNYMVLPEINTKKLIVTISPENAWNKSVSLSSSDTLVAKVNPYHKAQVEAVHSGVATITVTALDGGYTESCTVTVLEEVDLGLSVKWRSKNVGASSPKEEGGYYAWGETSEKRVYNWLTYKYCNGSETTMTKYCNKSSYGYNGFTDNKTVLDLTDDVARAKLGGLWRMPTEAECKELIEQCNWTWTTQNGVNGYRVTSKTNGNSIFLPGNIWSSSLYQDSGIRAVYLYNRLLYTNRYCGIPVRPVLGKEGESESVSISKTSLTITAGETYQMTATVYPSDATNKSVSWSSSDTLVAKVDSSGIVTGLYVGTAAIIASTQDRGYTAFCTVNVQVAVPDFVDLGLSVKWGSFNLGAFSPEGYGDYYAWGETEPKGYYNWSTYKYCNGSETTLTKYCNDSSYGYNGFTDNKTVLDLSDDVARVKLGGSWRMPTDAEWTELREQCTWTWTTQNGVNGYQVTSKTNGNSIFLPAAGHRDRLLFYVGSYGYYWSSTLTTDYPYSAWRVSFGSSFVSGYYHYRYFGYSVRPVQN